VILTSKCFALDEEAITTYFKRLTCTAQGLVFRIVENKNKKIKI
jgi:hypothetical protein